jgi:hypothetical protein
MGLINGGGKPYVPTFFLRPVSFQGKRNGQPTVYGGLGRKIDQATYKGAFDDNPQSVVVQKKKNGEAVYLLKYNALSGVFRGFRLGSMEVNGGQVTTISALFEEPEEKSFYIVDLGPADKSRAMTFYKALLHQNFVADKEVVVSFNADTFEDKNGEQKVALRPVLYQEGAADAAGNATKLWLHTTFKSKDGEVRNSGLANMPIPAEEEDGFGNTEKDLKPQIKWLKVQMKEKFAFVKDTDLGQWLNENFPDYVVRNTPTSAARAAQQQAVTPATDEDDYDPFEETLETKKGKVTQQPHKVEHPDEGPDELPF